MNELTRLSSIVRNELAQWNNVYLADLQFWHQNAAQRLLVGLIGLTVILLIVRAGLRRETNPSGVVLPALLRTVRPSRVAWLLHLPVVLFVTGIPFFALALADPHTALISRQVTYPGRRIGIMIDASISMRTPFTAATLNQRAPTEASFFTTVAAAERFVQMRISGEYRDLMALVEFGHQAYVITPFTSDYENLLLSISLIGDPVEFNHFPDQGTIIAQGLEESIALFKAFDFLDASGNIMIIFTDGEDTVVRSKKQTLDEILQSAVDAEIPLYMVRTNYARDEGQIIPDELWRRAVLRTGGRFYAASDEASLIAAIEDIDRVSAGTIEMRSYSSQEPRFAGFTLIAVLLWAAAAGLKLSTSLFQKLS
jgi:Ca-activated chloride channel family protein